MGFIPCYKYFIMENWVHVIGYDGIYEISNKGQIKCLPKLIEMPNNGASFYTKEKIKSIRKANIEKGVTNAIIEYSDNGINKRYNLSKQVLLHFDSNYNNEPVYFKDGNRNNCSFDNLVKVTKDNVINLYNEKNIVPPNDVSKLLHEIGYKKCSICKKIKLNDCFGKSTRNRGKSNNCKKCVIKENEKYRLNNYL